MKNTLTLLIFLLLFCAVSAVPLRDFPIQVTQPDGRTLSLTITGDEYYRALYDTNHYTVIKNKNTGYFTYAKEQNGELIASDYIVGVANPQTISELTPAMKPTTAVLTAKRNAIRQYKHEVTGKTPAIGQVNKLAFIPFV